MEDTRIGHRLAQPQGLLLHEQELLPFSFVKIEREEDRHTILKEALKVDIKLPMEKTTINLKVNILAIHNITICEDLAKLNDRNYSDENKRNGILWTLAQLIGAEEARLRLYKLAEEEGKMPLAVKEISNLSWKTFLSTMEHFKKYAATTMAGEFPPSTRNTINKDGPPAIQDGKTSVLSNPSLIADDESDSETIQAIIETGRRKSKEAAKTTGDQGLAKHKVIISYESPAVFNPSWKPLFFKGAKIAGRECKEPLTPELPSIDGTDAQDSGEVKPAIDVPESDKIVIHPITPEEEARRRRREIRRENLVRLCLGRPVIVSDVRSQFHGEVVEHWEDFDFRPIPRKYIYPDGLFVPDSSYLDRGGTEPCKYMSKSSSECVYDQNHDHNDNPRAHDSPPPEKKKKSRLPGLTTDPQNTRAERAAARNVDGNGYQVNNLEKFKTEPANASPPGQLHLTQSNDSKNIPVPHNAPKPKKRSHSERGTMNSDVGFVVPDDEADHSDSDYSPPTAKLPKIYDKDNRDKNTGTKRKPMRSGLVARS